MKRFMLSATAAAIALGFSGMASAALNLDNGTGTGGSYAGEAVIDATTGTDLKRTAVVGVGNADQVATVAFGASFATNFVAYVRYDLSSGTFTADPSYAVDDSAAAPANVSIAQGGVGQSYVIFAIAPTAGNNLAGANVGTFTGAGITVKNKNAITLTYRLYETLTNAANQVLSLKSAAGGFTSFAPAVAVVPGNAITSTADVAAANGPYTAFVGGGVEAPILSFTVTHTPQALPATGVGSTVTDIIGNTNAVALSGDFTAANAVTLDTSSTCAGAGVLGTINAAKDGVAFTGITAANITAAPWYGCFGVNGTTAIPAASYTGAVDLVAANPTVSPTDGPTGTGSIVRNGTVLKAAFAETTSASGVSTAVSLTNTGTLAAPYTVRCILNNGSVAGNPGTVPAGTAIRLGLSNSLGCPANGTLRGLEITLAVPQGKVIGSIVRQNTSTGQASFDGMTGNQ